jgi:MerR family transcriptional regulator, light-induced transcriptional regulator
MHGQPVAIDRKALAQAAQTFAHKRSALPADVVEGFAREIVARVARAVSARDGSRVDCDSVTEFCDVLLEPDQPARALAFITARQSDGASMPDIYLGYVGGAARLLGERWDSGDLTPLDVTMAAGTLYALMRALRVTPTGGRPPDPRRSALFATVPGEHHGIGITVAANIFRAAGWDIDLQLGLDRAALVDRASRTRPTILGLSLSTADRLPELLGAVVALRLALPDAILGVATGGAGLVENDLRRIADIDLVFGDAPSSLATLDRLISRPSAE